MLARISHRVSTAASDPGMSTALRSVALGAEPPDAPCIHARLRRLATKPCEKCGPWARAQMPARRAPKGCRMFNFSSPRAQFSMLLEFKRGQQTVKLLWREPCGQRFSLGQESRDKTGQAQQSYIRKSLTIFPFLRSLCLPLDDARSLT